MSCSGLRGQAFSVSPLSEMSAVGSSYVAFVCWDVLPLSPAFESFYQERTSNCATCFFCIYGDEHVDSILHYVNAAHHVSRLVDVEPSLHPGNKSHVGVVNRLLNALLNSVC